MGTHVARAKGGRLVSYGFFAGAVLTVASGVALASMTHVHFVALGTWGGAAFTVGAPAAQVDTGGEPRIAAGLKIQVEPWWGSQRAKVAFSVSGARGRGFRWAARAAAVSEDRDESRRHADVGEDECAQLEPAATPAKI